jgi:hypothetical protein
MNESYQNGRYGAVETSSADAGEAKKGFMGLAWVQKIALVSAGVAVGVVAGMLATSSHSWTYSADPAVQKAVPTTPENDHENIEARIRAESERTSLQRKHRNRELRMLNMFSH